METIDLVVHAAGTLGGTYARKQTFEQWHAIMSANLDSCFVVTAAVLPRMRAGSRLVFISSSAAHEPMMARKHGTRPGGERHRRLQSGSGIAVDRLVGGPAFSSQTPGEPLDPVGTAP